jgi:nickel transport protein
MKKIVKLTALAAITTSLLAGAAAQAHGIWFAQRATQLALLYGVGADDLDIVKRASQVTSVSGFDAAGKPVPTTPQPDGRLMLVDTSNQPAVVAAVLDNGTWSKTPEGKWHKKGKDEVPNAVVSEHTYKYAVHLRAPLTAPLGAFRATCCRWCRWRRRCRRCWATRSRCACSTRASRWPARACCTTGSTTRTASRS